MIALGRIVESLALPVAGVLLALIAGLIAFALIRRITRRRHSRVLDELATVCAPLVEAQVAGPANQDADSDLQAISGAWKVCEDLGLVKVWQRRLADQYSRSLFKRLFSRGYSLVERTHLFSFVLRAEAAENLGIIRHQPSWPLLAEALHDSHLTVASTAARALAAIQKPDSFPALAERLQAAALNPAAEMSARTLVMALASFPSLTSVGLKHLLVHPHGRARFLAADVIAVMLRQEAKRAGAAAGPESSSNFPPEVAEIVLTRLVVDENADVRARAADVAGYLQHPRAMSAILALLTDAEWFVRLHAVRAIAYQKLMPLAAVRDRLTDPNWRVREASAQTLSARGGLGVEYLLDPFVNTADRYSQEQVAEQIVRAGLLPSLVASFGITGRERETRFIEGIIRLGKGDALLPVLRSALPLAKRKMLLKSLSSHPDPTVHSFAQTQACVDC
ncbi:MAG TPA: HEAT repeat domain-containing protein [Terriglobia bacterium]